MFFKKKKKKKLRYVVSRTNSASPAIQQFSWFYLNFRTFPHRDGNYKKMPTEESSSPSVVRGQVDWWPNKQICSLLVQIEGAKQLKHEVGKPPMYTELSNLAGGGGSPVVTDTSMQGLSYPSLHCDQINLISRRRNSWRCRNNLTISTPEAAFGFRKGSLEGTCPVFPGIQEQGPGLAGVTPAPKNLKETSYGNPQCLSFQLFLQLRQ